MLVFLLTHDNRASWLKRSRLKKLDVNGKASCWGWIYHSELGCLVFDILHVLDVLTFVLRCTRPAANRSTQTSPSSSLFDIYLPLLDTRIPCLSCIPAGWIYAIWRTFASGLSKYHTRYLKICSMFAYAAKPCKEVKRCCKRNSHFRNAHRCE